MVPNGKELLESLKTDANQAFLLEHYTEMEITQSLIEMDDAITLNCYSCRIPKLVHILLNNPPLLHKCDGHALAWLLENPLAVKTILRNNGLIQKTEESALANLVKEEGLWVWQRLKEAGKDDFVDGNLLCRAAENDEDVALDIIQDDEKIKKIVQQPLNGNFFNHEQVALVLIKNPIFMEYASSADLFAIAIRHASCALDLFSNLNAIPQFQDLTNDLREQLKKTYPFWIQANRALNAQELSILALNEDRIQAALEIDPNVATLQDEHGRTLLHYVAQNGFYMDAAPLKRILDLLWASRIDFGIQDENGDTPLHIVSEAIHDKVSSSFTFAAFVSEAQRRNHNMLLTNKQNQTFVDVLLNNMETEYFTTRGLRHPHITLNAPNHDPALQAAIYESFEAPAQDQIVTRDLVSVNEFLKAELSAAHGFFNEELSKLALNQQLTLIRYLIAMHSGQPYTRKRALENKLNAMDEWKVMLSIENAIKVITRKDGITQEHIQTVRQHYLNNLRTCERELLNLGADLQPQSANVCLRVCSGVAFVLGPVALMLAFTALNVATLGSTAGLAFAIGGGVAFFCGALGLFATRNKNPMQIPESGRLAGCGLYSAVVV